MPKARDPNRDKAYKIYSKAAGNIDLVEIASQLRIPPGTVRGWKNKDKWDDQMSGTFQPKPERATERSNPTTRSDGKLNDKQELFCLYYSKSFNATRSYLKAFGCSYESAMTLGPKLLGNVRVREEVNRMKEERYSKEMLKPEDIFQKFMDIAYSDVTDYLEFGREEVPVMGPFGPVEVKDEYGNKQAVTKIVNTVRFKESHEVDGSIITEVKQGKDGASIKLADRMKALEWLADHMNMATEEQQARIDALKSKTVDVKDDREVGVIMLPPALDGA